MSIKIQYNNGDDTYTYLSPDYSVSATNADTLDGYHAQYFLNEINTLKTSVSNGKATVAGAITDKGISTSASASFQTMADNISKINSIENFSSSSFLFGNFRNRGKIYEVVCFSNNFPDRLLFQMGGRINSYNAIQNWYFYEFTLTGLKNIVDNNQTNNSLSFSAKSLTFTVNTSNWNVTQNFNTSTFTGRVSGGTNSNSYKVLTLDQLSFSTGNTYGDYGIVVPF